MINKGDASSYKRESLAVLHIALLLSVAIIIGLLFRLAPTECYVNTLCQYLHICYKISVCAFNGSRTIRRPDNSPTDNWPPDDWPPDDSPTLIRPTDNSPHGRFAPCMGGQFAPIELFEKDIVFHLYISSISSRDTKRTKQYLQSMHIFDFKF